MIDFDTLLRFTFALGVVLALIAVVTWFAKRYLGPGVALAGGRRRRLAVLETAAIDSRTRLVLVRLDDTEHLIACGPAGIAPIGPGHRSQDPTS